jgi:hypothetical protein
MNTTIGPYGECIHAADFELLMHRLECSIKHHGGVKATARVLGEAEQDISAWRNRRRRMPERMLQRFGFTRVVRYVPTEEVT